jgi:hypothetical protein
MNVLDFIKQTLIGKRVYFLDSQTEGEILDAEYYESITPKHQSPAIELFIEVETGEQLWEEINSNIQILDK